MPESPDVHPSQTDFAALLFKGDDALNLTHHHLPDLMGFPEFLPIFGVRLVRSEYVRFEERPRVRRPADAAQVAWRYLRHTDREQMLAVLLDTRNAVIGLNVVSVGDLSGTLVHPREVFKAAILANAAGIILAHNHPSGDPAPSPEDIAVTKRIEQAGTILGISVLDHVVVAGEGRFVSLKERLLF